MKFRWGILILGILVGSVGSLAVLSKTVGEAYTDYNFATCNCANFMEDQLGKVGISLPRDDEIFGIDTPNGTLREATEYEGKQRR